jgi:hypothetical protein
VFSEVRMAGSISAVTMEAQMLRREGFYARSAASGAGMATVNAVSSQGSALAIKMNSSAKTPRMVEIA